MFKLDSRGEIIAEYCDICGCDTANPCGCIDDGQNDEIIILPIQYEENLMTRSDYIDFRCKGKV